MELKLEPLQSMTESGIHGKGVQHWPGGDAGVMITPQLVVTGLANTLKGDAGVFKLLRRVAKALDNTPIKINRTHAGSYTPPARVNLARPSLNDAPAHNAGLE
ncbi:hypothetical protein L1987_85019 [Smallanthus sonchifolius]|uniref:Uncharacterized protein n=1 Tax=Smallanthus sonchifolius TaxID=185202 RepID=A0ACB8XUS0_9ASTR|nr:hypothetical protein L1987_85019 [Smallanthus sonchifolius]